MNRKIKRIIAIALTLSAISTVTPTIGLITTKAYASTSDTQLKSIYLSEGTIDFSSSTYSYTVKVGSSVDELRITAKPKNEDSTVEIDGTTVDEEDKYRETVSLDKGKNTIKIKVTDEEDDKTKTYTLTVYRGTSGSYDDVYLKDIYLNTGKIDFDKDDNSYDVSVSSSVDKIEITAKPEDEDYTVKIDGHEVDDDDNYKRKVDLNEGKNAIKVEVEDEDNDEKKTYTLNITRGTVATTPTATIKANQWVYVNGQMQYNDDFGKPLKNTWFWDKNTSKYYYLDGNGYKTIGWLYNNSNWYLLDYNGEMLKGWQYKNGAWYYLDESGVMKTGWIKDSSGSWYYLNSNGTMKTGWMVYNGKYYHLSSNGSMDRNTTIDGYKLGSDGAWTMTR